jgi:hypothetical protein
MGPIFKYDFRVRIWPLTYIPYGAIDFGEILAVARAIDEGDDDAFCAAWDRFAAAADEVRRLSARALFLKASCAGSPRRCAGGLCGNCWALASSLSRGAPQSRLGGPRSRIEQRVQRRHRLGR